MGETLERWERVGRADAVQGQHFWGGGGLGQEMRWDGRGSKKICASWLVNHARTAGSLSILQSDRARTHTPKHVYKKTNNSTHKKKKHTYALNTGRPNCHWSAVCAHSLWHEYSKNIPIIPIMHVYTVCECKHRFTKMSFVLKFRNHVEYRGLVGRPYNTLTVICCWSETCPCHCITNMDNVVWPVGLHHDQKIKAPNMIRGTPVPERCGLIRGASGRSLKW